MKRRPHCGIFGVALCVLAPFSLLAQQEYVGRYGVNVGYEFLDSPHINLFENGVQVQAGFKPRTWYALGFDYTNSSGDLVLLPGYLTNALQQQLGAELGQLAAAGAIPPGFKLAVPTHSRTQTYAAGPQFEYRHFAAVTLFVRPSVGAIHETSVPHPGDPIAARVVAQLAPSGRKTDWTGFYGVGGGIDFNITRHVALRTQVDIVHDHLFSDLLRDGRFTVRFGVGPYFGFGKNIAK